MGLRGNLELGQNGFDIISDTNPHLSTAFATNGVWFAIQAINASAVFSECTMTDGDDFDGETLDQGAFIYGKCTKITLTSGKVIAYRSETAP